MDELNSPILSAAFSEWDRTGNKVTAQDLSALVDKMGIKAAEVNIQYWIENRVNSGLN